MDDRAVGPRRRISSRRLTASPGRAASVAEQPELGRGERRRSPRPQAAACVDRIEHEVAHRGGRVEAGALEQRAEPRHQLGEGEGLGQVVVAAGAETRTAGR